MPKVKARVKQGPRPVQARGKEEACPVQDVALKSFFLGPQSENGTWLLRAVDTMLNRWFTWRRGIYPGDGRAVSINDQASDEYVARQRHFAARLHELMGQFEAEVPKFSPRYIGHMFSEISLPAILGHIVALLHNPNIISGEAGPVGVEIEEKAIRDLAVMIGYGKDRASGHFTSGGTIANFEAMVRARARLCLWMAASARHRQERGGRQAAGGLFAAAHLGWDAYDQLHAEAAGESADEEKFNSLLGNPITVAANLKKIYRHDYLGPVVLVPVTAHYSWKKGVSLLGMGSEALWPISLDAVGRIDLRHLRQLLAKAEAEERPVLMVVTVAGSTELGLFDPVAAVQKLLDDLARRQGYHIWHHVDAAYGGFFATINPEDPCLRGTSVGEAVAAFGGVTSITLDPHKLGYVPYASGSIIVREPRDYFVSAQGAPYISFRGRDRGPFTLEGSRPATGAAATWMTSNTIGLTADGYGRILARTIRVRQQLEARLRAAALPIRIAPGCEANIIGLALAHTGESLATVNERMEAIYAQLSPERRGPLIVSKTTISEKAYGRYFREFVKSWGGRPRPGDQLVLLRLCILNPFCGSKEMDLDFDGAVVAALTEAMASVN